MTDRRHRSGQFGRLLFFLLPHLFFLYSTAQTATIEGTVTGGDHQEGLIGVNIILEGTIYGTISGHHGEYILGDIPEGTYTIRYSYLGYQSVATEIHIDPGEHVVKDVVLEPGALDLSSVTIVTNQPFSAASSTAIRNFDLKVKPVRTAQDILTLAPGLFIAQHAGGGKAEQLFLRGFDADHGTDIGVYVDGLPVNMVSHGHGQGYADLHFIIPEIVDGMTVYKGPYFARFGNFGTAGSVDLTTTDHPEKNLLKMEGGMFNTARATAVLKIPTNGDHQSAYIAGQYSHSDGPFESPQGFNRMNVYGKFHTHVSERSELRLAFGAFTSAWDASGQIPQRAVQSGLITRWGAIDDMEGGVTSRYNASLDYEFSLGYDHNFMIQAFMSKYDFKLYSNFTFYLEDPINGDMIEQDDHRNIYGINTKYSFRKSLGRVLLHTKLGTSFRGDRIDLSLWKAPARRRLEVMTEDRVNENNMAFWLEQDVVFGPRFKVQLGVRGDYFTFDVVDHLEDPDFPGNGLPHASGYAQSGILSPKFNAVWSPWDALDIYVNAGTGFHSNDARDVVIAARIREIIQDGERRGLTREEIDQELAAGYFDPEHQDIQTLPRASGAELGSRISFGPRVLASVALWYLHMNEELVYVGDAGTTEISGETRRLGLDLEVKLQITNWMWADADLNLADGRYTGEPEGANYIPLAPRFTSQGGVNFQHRSGFDGAIRYRYMADRPANEDNSVVATGLFLGNIVIGYRFRGFRIFGQIENLFNVEWNEAQFDTESRLYDEPVPVSELHYTPGNPFNIQAGLMFEF